MNLTDFLESEVQKVEAQGLEYLFTTSERKVNKYFQAANTVGATLRGVKQEDESIKLYSEPGRDMEDFWKECGEYELS